MSTIDQAFVKAFHKNRQAADATEPVEPSAEARAAALGMSTIWIDPSSEQQWRSDAAHASPAGLTHNRLRGGGPDRRKRSAAFRSAEPRDPRRGQPVGASETDELCSPRQADNPEALPPASPSAVTPNEVIPNEVIPNDQVAETAIDIHMFDAIDVTPSPFAIFSSPDAVAEAPSRRAPRPHDLPAPESHDGDRSVPSSVPFVKIHQRAVPGFAEAGAGVAMPEVEAEALAAQEAGPFEAAWELDRLEQPPVVEKLLNEGGLLPDAVAPLVDACGAGLQTLMVTGSAAQEGRTTLATGLALGTARAGLRVALLDLDAQRPGLADQLQLAVEIGWNEAGRKGVPLEETAIYCLEDRLTLLPIVGSAPRVIPTREEIVKTLKRLRESFDLIVIDAGSIDVETAMTTQLPARQMDSALVVRDRREADESGFEECVAALGQLGIDHIGIADNFVGSTS